MCVLDITDRHACGEAVMHLDIGVTRVPITGRHLDMRRHIDKDSHTTDRHAEK